MTPRLGIRANLAQFSLLVLVNGFVGAMVGMERAILPAIAEGELHAAVAVFAALTFASGAVVAVRMRETMPRDREEP